METALSMVHEHVGTWSFKISPGDAFGHLNCRELIYKRCSNRMYVLNLTEDKQNLDYLDGFRKLCFVLSIRSRHS